MNGTQIATAFVIGLILGAALFWIFNQNDEDEQVLCYCQPGAGGDGTSWISSPEGHENACAIVAKQEELSCANQ